MQRGQTSRWRDDDAQIWGKTQAGNTPSSKKQIPLEDIYNLKTIKLNVSSSCQEPKDM